MRRGFDNDDAGARAVFKTHARARRGGLRPVLITAPDAPRQEVVRSHAIRCGANPKGNLMSRQILIAFTILHVGQNEFARRTRIGVAWPHAGDGSYTVELDTIPLSGQFILVPQDATDGTP
jgi:hypothetical protein